jgi:N-acetylmuramoyl-L-alanine amidase CwlA
VTKTKDNLFKDTNTVVVSSTEILDNPKFSFNPLDYMTKEQRKDILITRREGGVQKHRAAQKLKKLMWDKMDDDHKKKLWGIIVLAEKQKENHRKAEATLDQLLCAMGVPDPGTKARRGIVEEMTSKEGEE